MTAVDFARVRIVLDEVRELTGPHLERRLRQLCADDGALEAEVRSLLAAGDAPDSRLETPDDRRNLLDDVLALDAATAADRGAPPTRIGPYRLGRLLGAGGMGRVFEAIRDDPPDRVALKLLAPGRATPELRDRFRREVAVLARLSHPDIAALIDSGTLETAAGPQPWFAMPLVEGRPLDAWVRECRPTPDEVLELVATVAEAVAHAHRQGVVHRDLKPGNVLVRKDDRPAVLDFGVARLIGEDSWLTSLHTLPGQLIGTLPYMSPEQVSDDPDAVDARSDVYALGVILFEALSGRLPVETAGLPVPAAALRIRDQDPPRLGELVPTLGGDLDVLLEAALAKEPERRYADAGALADDLRRFLQRRELVARPPSTWDQLVRFVRRNRLLAGSLATVLLILVGATTVSLVQADRLADQRDRALLEADRSRLSAAAAALQAQDPLAASASLEAVSPAGRAWEWRHLAARVEPRGRGLEAPPETVDATLRQGGDELVLVTADGWVERRRTGADEVHSRVQLAGDAPRPRRLAPDGGRCLGLLEDGRTVALWDTADGALLARTPVLPDSGLEGPAEPWALDGDGRTTGWREGQRFRIWRPDQGEAPHDFTVDQRRAWRTAALRPDRLALGSLSGQVDLVSLDPSGRPRQEASLRPDTQRIAALAFDKDGDRLAVSTTRTTVVVLESLTGDILHELEGHTRPAGALHFVDEDRLLSFAGDGTLRRWDLDRGALASSDSCLGFQILGLRQAAEGGPLLGLDPEGRPSLWETGDASWGRTLRGHESYVYDVVFSPDGDSLASLSWDRSVCWWDRATGAPLGRWQLSAWPIRLHRGPGGRELVVTTRQETLRGDGARPSELVPLVPGAGQAHDLLWTDDGDLLLSSHTLDGEPHPPALYDGASGALRRTLEMGDRRVEALALLADPGRLVSGHVDGGLAVWSWPGLELDRHLALHDDRVADLLASPDGRQLVSAGWDGQAWLLDTETWDARPLSGHPDRVHAVAWHPDGRRLATACQDGQVRLYDARDGALVARLRGHGDYVHGLAFSPGGDVLASASGDGTVRLWRALPAGR